MMLYVLLWLVPINAIGCHRSTKEQTEIHPNDLLKHFKKQNMKGMVKFIFANKHLCEILNILKSKGLPTYE